MISAKAADFSSLQVTKWRNLCLSANHLPACCRGRICHWHMRAAGCIIAACSAEAAARKQIRCTADPWNRIVIMYFLSFILIFAFVNGSIAILLFIFVALVVALVHFMISWTFI